jgi:hypothetical protein
MKTKTPLIIFAVGLLLAVAGFVVLMAQCSKYFQMYDDILNGRKPEEKPAEEITPESTDKIDNNGSNTTRPGEAT